MCADKADELEICKQKDFFNSVVELDERYVKVDIRMAINEELCLVFDFSCCCCVRGSMGEGQKWVVGFGV